MRVRVCVRALFVLAPLQRGNDLVPALARPQANYLELNKGQSFIFPSLGFSIC